MNIDAMPRKKTTPLSALALTLALAGCNAPSAQPRQQAQDRGADSGSADLRGSAIGGPFTLVDKHGKTVHWSDFDGHYRVVYFGYTYCPDVCPTDMQRTVKGEQIFARDHPALAKNLRTIFISVDPERDTPEMVGEFAAAFSPDVIGLTGSQEQVKAAEDAFKVYASKGAKQPGGGYLVNHSAITYLFDKQGKPLATLPTDQGPQAVAAALAKWMQ